MSYHADVIKWKHFPHYWPFVKGIHQSLVNSPHKGQWCGAMMFSLICAWKKRFSTPSRCRWFETPLHSLWHHCNVWISKELCVMQSYSNHLCTMTKYHRCFHANHDICQSKWLATFLATGVRGDRPINLNNIVNGNKGPMPWEWCRHQGYAYNSEVASNPTNKHP